LPCFSAPKLGGIELLLPAVFHLELVVLRQQLLSSIDGVHVEESGPPLKLAAKAVTHRYLRAQATHFIVRRHKKGLLCGDSVAVQAQILR